MKNPEMLRSLQAQACKPGLSVFFFFFKEMYDRSKYSFILVDQTVKDNFIAHNPSHLVLVRTRFDLGYLIITMSDFFPIKYTIFYK
jgi:hypothetical protein